MNYIVLGNLSHVDKLTTTTDEPFILMKCQELLLGANTLFLNGDQLDEERLCWLCSGESLKSITDWSISGIFNGMRVKTSFLNKMQEHENVVFSERLVPLLCLSLTKEQTAVYSILRYSWHDMIFIKTVQETPTKDCDLHTLICKGISAHQEHQVFLGNHQCYYRKEDSEKEIEYKYNLSGSADPWLLINDLFEDIENGRLKNFIFEYHDEFQKWDYMNYMFEIYGDETQKGYVSFIPQTNGTYLIKRKIYSHDQLSRIEMHQKNVKIDIPLKDYVESTMKLICKEFPPFRRVRYDVNIENIMTGNVSSIMFDLITVEDLSPRLMQCEIEYVRTRSLFGNNSYLDELKQLKDYMTTFFETRKIDHHETYYSKLSFMRDICGDISQ